MANDQYLIELATYRKESTICRVLKRQMTPEVTKGQGHGLFRSALDESQLQEWNKIERKGTVYL